MPSTIEKATSMNSIEKYWLYLVEENNSCENQLPNRDSPIADKLEEMAKKEKEVKTKLFCSLMSVAELCQRNRAVAIPSPKMPVAILDRTSNKPQAPYSTRGISLV